MRYWKRINENKEITTVESYSHALEVEGAVEITEIEYDNFIASLPKPIIQPTRDLAAEIDELKAKMVVLEKK